MDCTNTCDFGIQAALRSYYYFSGTAMIGDNRISF